MPALTPTLTSTLALTLTLTLTLTKTIGSIGSSLVRNITFRDCHMPNTVKVS